MMASMDDADKIRRDREMKLFLVPAYCHRFPFAAAFVMNEFLPVMLYGM
jgi:hypothetical protein